MLAKVWKKALLVICILACIYNVMHKLVSRTSLELQLESVQNQSSIIDMLDADLETTNQTNQMTQNSSETEKETNTIHYENNTTKSTNDSIVVIY